MTSETIAAGDGESIKAETALDLIKLISIKTELGQIYLRRLQLSFPPRPRGKVNSSSAPRIRLSFFLFSPPWQSVLINLPLARNIEARRRPTAGNPYQIPILIRCRLGWWRKSFSVSFFGVAKPPTIGVGKLSGN